MPVFLRPFWRAFVIVDLQRLRFTVWRSARLEGVYGNNGFTSIDRSNGDTIDVQPAAFQRMLASRFARLVRQISFFYSGSLMRVRNRLKRRMRTREKIDAKLESAKRRCPPDADRSIVGASAALALSIVVSIPLSWGFVEEFEQTFVITVIACVGLSLIDAAISHVSGRLFATLALDEPDGPFELTVKQRLSYRIMLALHLLASLAFIIVFAAFRSNHEGSFWLWLAVGLAAFLIAAWSGYVSYPVWRSIRVSLLEGSLARADQRMAKAYDALELTVRRMSASAETMRHRLMDINHRGGITLVRAHRRHNPDTLPPTMPDPDFISEQEVSDCLLRPHGDIDIVGALSVNTALDQTVASRPGHGHSPERRVRAGRLGTSTTTTLRIRQ
jgi:hypothetical protein